MMFPNTWTNLKSLLLKFTKLLLAECDLISKSNKLPFIWSEILAIIIPECLFCSHTSFTTPQINI